MLFKHVTKNFTPKVSAGDFVAGYFSEPGQGNQWAVVHRQTGDVKYCHPGNNNLNSAFTMARILYDDAHREAGEQS